MLGTTVRPSDSESATLGLKGGGAVGVDAGGNWEGQWAAAGCCAIQSALLVAACACQSTALGCSASGISQASVDGISALSLAALTLGRACRLGAVNVSLGGQ